MQFCQRKDFFGDITIYDVYFPYISANSILHILLYIYIRKEIFLVLPIFRFYVYCLSLFIMRYEIVLDHVIEHSYFYKF